MSIKHDQDKPRWDLLPVEPIEEIVKALTYGAKKYSDNNWKTVEPFTERYYAAMMRHIVEWRKGNLIDSESGLSHLTHAMCCMLFLMTKEEEDCIKTTNQIPQTVKPKSGETYWFINWWDEVDHATWIGDEVDKTRYCNGNCYNTEGQCKKVHDDNNGGKNNE